MEPLTGRAPRDQNRVPVTYGVSTADGVTVVPIEVDPATGRLQTSSSGGGSVTITSPIGQTTKSASVSVTLASDQGTLAVLDSAAETSLATIATNTTGLATSANQTNGTQQVQGNIASAATDSGNPVKVAGKLNTTRPTFTDGQRGDLQLDSRGNLGIAIFGAGSTTGAAASASGADAVSNSTAGINVYTLPRVYNGTTWDRATGTTSGAYSLIRDAAGNARGANVTASNELVVRDSNQGAYIIGGTAVLLNTYSVHLTTNTTTTPTASTAYISSITISNEVGGTTSSITIQDKQGTPLKLINGIATTALTTTPTVINFQSPVKMVSGIDIITAGAVAATVDVWIDYYQ